MQTALSQLKAKHRKLMHQRCCICNANYVGKTKGSLYTRITKVKMIKHLLELNPYDENS